MSIIGPSGVCEVDRVLHCAYCILHFAFCILHFAFRASSTPTDGPARQLPLEPMDAIRVRERTNQSNQAEVLPERMMC